jgi:hypothetical protein
MRYDDQGVSRPGYNVYGYVVWKLIYLDRNIIDACPCKKNKDKNYEYKMNMIASKTFTFSFVALRHHFRLFE